MKRLPILLIYSRIFISIIILLLAITKPRYFQGIIESLITIGLLTDIFDGIIARRLKISTTKLRRMDSNVDMIFWVSVIAVSYIICPAFYKQNYWSIGVLLFLEAVCYVVCFIKFRKEVATHAWSAKVWALTLFATLILVIDTDSSITLFRICFFVGVLSRLEIIAMLIVIKKWTNDIPTLYHAFKIRKNKPIKRYKLLNG